MNSTCKVLLTLLVLVTSKGFCQEIRPDATRVGQMAPDFTLVSLDGKPVRASDLWKKKPSVFMTGSLTCPKFRQKSPPLQALTKEFDTKANFLLIYTLEAHPKDQASPYAQKIWITPENERAGIFYSQPKTMEERMTLAKTCAQKLKINFPVVVDTLGNQVWKDYEKRANAALLVGTDGRILLSQPWMDTAELRVALYDSLRRP